jgi:uncharacterized protein (DUF2249 family)
MKKPQDPIPPLVLDVRPILAGGGSPCEPIEQAVAALRPGQNLVLLVPFEPVPLFAKLGREGFSHTAAQQADGTWKVVFSRPAETERPARDSTKQEVLLDNRGLEPPEPLVRTLEALGQLAPGGAIKMLSDRKPHHLFPELEARGFLFDCTEQSDHTFVTGIWRASDI